MLRQSLGRLPLISKKIKAKNKDSSGHKNNNPSGHSNVIPIVFHLPYDIMESVWSYLSLRERLQCTQVCQLWRTQLLGSQFMWSELDGNISRRLKPYRINGSDIRRADLEHDPDGIDFLLSLQCTNIQSITGANIQNGYVLMCFHELLCLTGPALRSLFVITDTPLEDLLSLIFMQCPDLTHFRLNTVKSYINLVPSNHSITADSPAAKSMKRVIDIGLTFMDIREYSLGRILSLFTGLKTISIESKYSPDRDWLPWLDDTFPGWQSIQLGKVPIEKKPHTDFRKQGCKTFTCGPGWIIDTTALENLLRNYGDVITAFHMANEFVPSHVCDVIRDYLINIGVSSRLCSLVLDGTHTLVYGINLENVLDGLPWLQQLILRKFRLDLNTAENKTRLPLEQLNRSLKIIKLVDCAGMKTQYLHRLAHRSHPCMQFIGFKSVELSPNDYLDTVANYVSSLDSLSLAHSNLTNDHLLKFAEKWKGKRLNSLRFRTVVTISSPRQLQSHLREILKDTDVTYYPIY